LGSLTSHHPKSTVERRQPNGDSLSEPAEINNHGRFPTYSLSDNLLELNKKQQKQTSFYTYLCTLLLAILAMDPAIAIRRLNLQPTKPTSKQASKASTTCLLGKTEALLLACLLAYLRM
jgi:hypothetical protein